MPTISIVDSSVYDNDVGKPTDGQKLLTDLNTAFTEVNNHVARLDIIEGTASTFGGVKTFSSTPIFQQGVNISRADDTLSFSDGLLWYNSTTDLFKGRRNGATDVFGMLDQTQTWSQTNTFSSAVNVTGQLNIGRASDPTPVDGDTWYNTTSDVFKGRINGVTQTFFTTADVATQAEMEAGSSFTKIPTPGTLQYHPGVAKAWFRSTYSAGVPQLTAVYNISSFTDNTSGDLTVNFTTAFSSANYGISAITQRAATNSGLFVAVAQGVAPTASACRLVTLTVSVIAEDPSFIAGSFFGDQ